ncbi:DNA ligase D [Solitalea longa]|uniref:DNA ligase (ATP) n=1 Tax=Solitalea longa TaxID=2079460 RepID=A0A2S5A4T2_9SPHI|nr:DNA ligase D [Solitalea longa]POY37309.1 DNA ligase D [Solitalea longa]
MAKLHEYIEKRDFTRTKEPKGGRNTGSKLSFVVQRHHASHLHYDFRLEMEGVLKSWAVPKGPSLNPADKRLAIMVEDHPYAYKDFEGEIAAGNYGAGNVIIWDEGFYTPLGNHASPEKELLKELKEGSLKIVLHGKRLKGEFALVKLKNAEDNSWLLIKHKDKFAVEDPYNSEDFVSKEVKQKKNSTSDTKPIKKKPVKLPEIKPFVPMLAKLGDKLPESSDWLFEPKLDGYRIVAVSNGNGTCKLFSRNSLDYSEKYKQIASILASIDRPFILDGEVVKEDEKGNISFHALQQFGKDPKGKIYYYVFDIIALDEHDLSDLPLIDRKKILKAFTSHLNDPQVIFTPYFEDDGEKMLDLARKEHKEGIMAKRSDSTYHTRIRTANWLKLKIDKEDEFIIAGYTEPRSGKEYLGAFLLGEFKNGKLVFAGKCGTGLNIKEEKEIYKELKKYEQEESPFSTVVKNDTPIHWLKPELVCTVKYTERTPSRKLRHPVFKALRNDKTAADMKPATSTIPDTIEKKIGRYKQTLTNQNKIYFPSGITKGQVIGYYEEIAEYILPYLKQRPLSLHRHPNGINGPSFFHKDIESKSYSWLKTVPIHSESNDKEIDYLVCNDVQTLLYMVNLGCIEINPWLSRYPKIEFPDFLVLDLDPEDIGFSQVIEVAQVINGFLSSLNIPSFPKTSGSTGIHIYIHVGAKYHYDSIKLFAEWLANHIHAEIPAITSIERSPKKRQKKIYIDFLQNRKGQTVAAPYSLRPKPNAPVSWPLAWKEVNQQLNMDDYTIANVPDLLKNGSDPWATIYDSIVNIAALLKSLDKK